MGSAHQLLVEHDSDGVPCGRCGQRIGASTLAAAAAARDPRARPLPL